MKKFSKNSTLIYKIKSASQEKILSYFSQIKKGLKKIRIKKKKITGAKP